MRQIKQAQITVLILIATVLVTYFPSSSELMRLATIGLGTIILLFLPGYWITECFFTDKEMDQVERIALSFALSISIVPLLTYIMNLIGLPISAFSVLILVAAIITSTFFYLFIVKLSR